MLTTLMFTSPFWLWAYKWNFISSIPSQIKEELCEQVYPTRLSRKSTFHQWLSGSKVSEEGELPSFGLKKKELASLLAQGLA